MENSVAGTVLTPAFLTDGPWLTDEDFVAVTGYRLNYLRGLRSKGHLPKSTKFVVETVDRTGKPIRIPKGFNKVADIRAWLVENGKPEKAEALDHLVATKLAQGVA